MTVTDLGMMNRLVRTVLTNAFTNRATILTLKSKVVNEQEIRDEQSKHGQQ